MVVVRWRSRSLISRRLWSFKFLCLGNFTVFERAVDLGFEMAFGATFGMLCMLSVVGLRGDRKFCKNSKVELRASSKVLRRVEDKRKLGGKKLENQKDPGKRGGNLQQKSLWSALVDCRFGTDLDFDGRRPFKGDQGTSRRFFETLKVSNTISAVDDRRSLGWLLMVHILNNNALGCLGGKHPERKRIWQLSSGPTLLHAT